MADGTTQGNEGKQALPYYMNGSGTASGNEEIVETEECTIIRNGWYKECRSKKRYLGVPLYHIVNWPRKPGGGFVVAKGIFAYGFFSIGIFSVGVLTAGLVAIGNIGFGLVTSVANLALAAVACIGNIAVSIGWSLGNIAVGYSAAGSIVVEYGTGAK